MMDDQAFRQLLEHLNLSWKGYRRVRKGVKKRIRRHMQTLKCREMSVYLAELDRSREVRETCDDLMRVTISRFLRDQKFWQTLENELLPNLIQHYPDEIEVWSAGCANGEEVYSLKIVWEHLKKKIPDLPKLQICATDAKTVCLARAREGIYPRRSLRNVNDDDLRLFFTPHNKQFAVKKSLKQSIKWRVHELLVDLPPSTFNVIFLRNHLLTYYQDPLKIPVFEKIINALQPAGILIIGAHEKLPLRTADLMPIAAHSFVFIKRGRL